MKKLKFLTTFLLFCIFFQTLFSQPQVLDLDNPDSGDFFGSSIDTYEDHLVIGAWGHDYNGLANAGMAYLYKLENGNWEFQTPLIPSVPSYNADYGRSVAIDGDRIVVGAYNGEYNGIKSGAVFIFKNEGGNWVEEQMLLPSVPSENARFGWSVALEGNDLLIGSTGETAAYFFEYTANGWEETQVINVSSAPLGGLISAGVDIENNRAIINASYSKQAFIYEKEGNTWVEKQELGKAGWQAKLEGNQVFITQPTDFLSNQHRGLIDVYELVGTTWQHIQALKGSDLNYSGGFGFDIEVKGDLLLVGAEGSGFTSSVSNVGATYLFRKINGFWIEEDRILSDAPEPYNYFGSAVAIGEDYLFVGERDRTIGSVGSSGATLVFDRATFDNRNRIVGKVFNDLNGNCQLDSGEPGFDNWKVNAIGANPTAALSLTNGDYALFVDGLTHEVQFESYPDFPYWNSCETTYNVQFSTTGQTIELNIPLQLSVDCSSLNNGITGFVDIGEFEGHRYFLSEEDMQPAAAIATAIANNGYLTTINSQAENDFIQQNISEMVYIGLNDEDLEDDLVWTNGESLTYNNIDPCSFCDENTDLLDYVIMAPWNGKWSFSSQWNSRKYIVEVPCQNTGGGTPDFTLSNVTGLPSTVESGDPINLSFDLNNIGTAASTTNQTIAAYLSIDQLFGSGDTYLADLTVGNTLIGTIAGLQLSFNIPNATDGDYYVIIIADVNGDIQELNTSNNGIEVPVTIESQTTGSGCPNSISGFTLLGEHNNSKYFISNENAKPIDAQAFATQNGGYLTVVNNEAENDFIQQNISEMVYIGLNDAQTEGSLQWVNGNALTYNNVDPCGFCDENSDGLDYVIIAPWNGSWSFSSQWNSRKYIVEIPCGNTPSNDCNSPTANFFEKTYPQVSDATVTEVIQTDDLGFLVFGTQTDNFFLMKTNTTGDYQWSQTYTSSNPSVSQKVLKTSDGGYLMWGNTMINGDEFSSLIKVDANGNQISNNTSTTHKSLGNYTQLSDGSFILLETPIDENDVNGLCMRKIDANGNDVSFVCLPGLETGENTNIVSNKFIEPTDDGNFLLIGSWSANIGPYGSIRTAKVTSTGIVLWVNEQLYKIYKRYNIVDAEKRDNGEIVLIGDIDQLLAGGNSEFIYHLNESGDIILEKNFGGSFIPNTWTEMVLDANEDILIAGSLCGQLHPFNNPPQCTELRKVYKYNASGDYVWSQNYLGYSGGSSSIKNTNDDGFIISGHRNGQIYLVKINEEGNSCSDLLPDLTMDNVSLSVNQNPNSDLTLFNEFSNIGTQNSTLFTNLSLVLSTDDEFSTDDILLQSYPGVSSLLINESGSINIFINFPNVPDGDYFIIAKVDAQELIEELDESNNVLVFPYTIGSFAGCDVFEMEFANVDDFSCVKELANGNIAVIVEENGQEFEKVVSPNGNLVSSNLISNNENSFEIINGTIVEKDNNGNILLEIAIDPSVVSQFSVTGNFYMNSRFGTANRSINNTYWVIGYEREINQNSSVGSGQDKIYAIKIDANGNLLFQNLVTTISFAYGPVSYFKLIPTPNGGLWLLRRENSFDDDVVFEMNIDPNGLLLSSSGGIPTDSFQMNKVTCEEDTYKIRNSQTPFPIISGTSQFYSQRIERKYLDNSKQDFYSVDYFQYLDGHSSGNQRRTTSNFYAEDGSRIYLLKDFNSFNTPIIDDYILRKYDANDNVLWEIESDLNFIPEYILEDQNGSLIFFELENNILSISRTSCDPPTTTTSCADNISGFEYLGEHNGHQYFLSDDSAKPTEAQAIAEQNGGYLAVINNQAENNFIQQNISEMVYIGLNDTQTEGMPAWVEGTSSFTNFDICSFCNENSNNLDYVLMHNWNGGWSWSSQWNSRKYIVEIPCPNPLITPPIPNTLITFPTEKENQLMLEAIMPNPASENIFVSLYSPIDDAVELQIFDARGVLVKSEKVALHDGDNTVNVSIQDLSGGFYFIKIPQAQANHSILRFVKARD